ncbi:NAD-binding protein [Mycoplasmopsis felis]|uniref:NAD-binding protein n=1 Tax=Mycoplasmopsis felis TaxID=33923 RepID=UPI0028BDD03D|nr:NAD-binding protein [Mycoplasmopsis felis]
MKYKHSEEIAVIGLGRFGQAVVEQLIKLGKSITIIDEDEDKLKIYADDVERLIVGDAAETKLLKSIGIEKFGTVVVAVLWKYRYYLSITRIESKKHYRKSNRSQKSKNFKTNRCRCYCKVPSMKQELELH